MARGVRIIWQNHEDQNIKNIKRHSTYPLRLPRSIKAEVERLAKRDGISINQFIVTAVAVKVSVSIRKYLALCELLVIAWRRSDKRGCGVGTNENRGRYDRSKLRYPSDPGFRGGRH